MIVPCSNDHGHCGDSVSMLTEDIVMGSAGSARPEVTVVEADSESSEDPDFEPGIGLLSRVACAFQVLQAKPQTAWMPGFCLFAIERSTCLCQGS